MEKLKDRKVQIGLAIVVFLLLVAVAIFFCTKKEEAKEEKKHIEMEYTMLVEINPSVKLTFQESYDECTTDGKQSICSEKEQRVIAYELINDDAKEIYKNIDFKGKKLYEAIATLCDTAKDNGIEFDSFEITSDWKAIPSEKELIQKAQEYSKYEEELTVTIKQDDQIKDYNPEVKTFDVTFDSDGGTKVTTQVVKENEQATMPENPTKKGYKFVEWQLDKKAYDFTEKVTKNITLKAVWKKESSQASTSFPENPSSSEILYPAGGASCIDRPDSFECKLEQAEAGMNEELEHNSDGYILKVYYHKNELYTVIVKSLNRCYEAYCGGWYGVQTFQVNEQNIKKNPPNYRELLYQHYSGGGVELKAIVTDAQNSYDKVVAKNYVEIQTKKVEELKTLLEKYKNYKDQDKLPDEDCTTTSFGSYYDSYAMLESLYQEESALLKKSQDDLNTVTEALKQAKIIASAFQN